MHPPERMIQAAKTALALFDDWKNKDGACICAQTFGACPTCGPFDVQDELRNALKEYIEASRKGQ